MLTSTILILFPVLMIASAVSDVLRFTIPNWMTGTLAALFFPSALLAGMPIDQIGNHLLASLIMLAVGFALFLPNYIGGGDAKLMAAAALWLGLDLLLPFAFYTTIFGGIMSLALISFRNLPLPARLTSVGWLERLHELRGPLPYGTAIAASGLMIFEQSPWFALVA